eukprot:gene781-biopygen6164
MCGRSRRVRARGQPSPRAAPRKDPRQRAVPAGDIRAPERSRAASCRRACTVASVADLGAGHGTAAPPMPSRLPSRRSRRGALSAQDSGARPSAVAAAADDTFTHRPVRRASRRADKTIGSLSVVVPLPASPVRRAALTAGSGHLTGAGSWRAALMGAGDAVRVGRGCGQCVHHPARRNVSLSLSCSWAGRTVRRWWVLPEADGPPACGHPARGQQFPVRSAVGATGVQSRQSGDACGPRGRARRQREARLRLTVEAVPRGRCDRRDIGPSRTLQTAALRAPRAQRRPRPHGGGAGRRRSLSCGYSSLLRWAGRRLLMTWPSALGRRVRRSAEFTLHKVTDSARASVCLPCGRGLSALAGVAVWGAGRFFHPGLIRQPDTSKPWPVLQLTRRGRRRCRPAPRHQRPPVGTVGPAARRKPSSARSRPPHGRGPRGGARATGQSNSPLRRALGGVCGSSAAPESGARRAAGRAGSRRGEDDSLPV